MRLLLEAAPALGLLRRAPHHPPPDVLVPGGELQLLQQLGLIETWIKGAVSKASNCDTLSKVTNSHKRGEEASRNFYQIDGIFYILVFALLMSLAGNSKLLRLLKT